MQKCSQNLHQQQRWRAVIVAKCSILDASWILAKGFRVRIIFSEVIQENYWLVLTVRRYRDRYKFPYWGFGAKTLSKFLVKDFGQNTIQMQEKNVRISHLQMFFKIGVLRNFAIFIGKYLCWSLFLIKL